MYLTTITPVYTITSILCSILSVFYAIWFQKRYTPEQIIMYFLSSKPCVVIHVNTCYVLLFLFGRMIMAFFIGKIRKKEFKQFQEKMVEYSGTNLVFVFYVLNQDTYATTLWITWFTIVGFFKVYTVIARERSRYYMSAPLMDNAQSKHAKLMGLLITIVTCDALLILISVKLLGFSNIGMLLFMMYECWVILVEASQTILKYKMFLDEYYNLKAWEGREEIGYILDFVLEIVRLSSRITHFIHIWIVDGYSLSVIDLALFMLINSSFNELRKHVNHFRHYLTVTGIISNSYPYATEEELKDNDTCIICHDSLTPTSAKKLECGHIFHETCIKKWMQKAFTCPVCRKPLMGLSGVHHYDGEDGEQHEHVLLPPVSQRQIQQNGNTQQESSNVASNNNSTDSKTASETNNDATNNPPSSEQSNSQNDAPNVVDPTVYRFDQTSNPWMRWLPFSVELEERPVQQDQPQISFDTTQTLRNRSTQSRQSAEE